jgi:hypothetical protein
MMQPWHIPAAADVFSEVSSMQNLAPKSFIKLKIFDGMPYS